MRVTRLALVVILLCSSPAFAQTPLARPKLVVGLVVDQLRWDYTYRFYDRLPAKGGFRRLLDRGFRCENTLIPYAPTVTACGHSTAYTGSVPAITGITGNAWWDRKQARSVYCTEDKTVQGVGSTGSAGQQSPRNMFTTTICDELRLATNFRSKVVGVALKDRGGILPAGHSANAAYWYDNGNGRWISSTYYMNELPGWVNAFNQQNLPDSFYRAGWSTLYPLSSYVQSTPDTQAYEAQPFGKGFPFNLSGFIGKDYGKLATTPMGNTLTAEFAKAAVRGEQLGADAITDFLAVSFSSTDYIGHSFGPNSVEAEDAFLRLDRDLGDFFAFLDRQVGAGQYLVFLTADHGVAQIPEFMTGHKLPAGRVMTGALEDELNKALKEKFGPAKLVLSDYNYQLHLNHRVIDSAGISLPALEAFIIRFLEREPGIDRAFPLRELNTTPLAGRIREMLNNGWHPDRSGDIQVIFKPHYIDAYSKTGTTHGLWNPYDAHIPLLWFGWGITPGSSQREISMSDIAPTLAALLNIQSPSGNVGKVITELVK